MENNNSSSSTNTILIVIILVIILGIVAWRVAVRNRIANPQGNYNVNVDLPNRDKNIDVNYVPQ